MHTHPVDKDLWVQIFHDIGMDEARMLAWHRAFEKRSPDGHQHFLKWLGISDTEIERIRAL